MRFRAIASFQFNETNLSKLVKALSTARLQRYLDLANGDIEKALEIHNWNTALASSFHLPLQIFELLFRNSLNDALTLKFSQTWYDVRFADFDPKAQATITAAKDYLIKQHRVITPSCVIALLTFGFWSGLLTKKYETTFWIPALKHAFPYAPSPVMRRTTFDALDKIRNLRNRIAHHEPIYTHDLIEELRHVCLVAAWICPDTAAWIDHCGEQLRSVLATRPY